MGQKCLSHTALATDGNTLRTAAVIAASSTADGKISELYESQLDKTRRNLFPELSMSEADGNKIYGDEVSASLHPSDTVLDTGVSPSNFGKVKLKKSSRVVFGNVWDNYTAENVIIGTGLSGSVHLASRLHRYYAIKTFKKRASQFWYYNEANVYLQLDHPNIARLMEIYENNEQLSLVMEYCSGGELFDRIVTRSSYSEADACSIVKQMLYAIQYLHIRNIVHRDLKLENWVYSSPTDNSLKLIDFGLSRMLNSPVAKMRRFCGTQSYMSPEVLRGSYTKACDMWSLGVLVYMVLTGAPPFFGTVKQIEQNILEGKFNTQNLQWMNASEVAQDFVKRLLLVSPEDRLSAADALYHPWILHHPEEPVNIDVNIFSSMKRFANTHKFQRAALSVMALWLSNEELEGMRDIFLSFDVSMEGSIMLKELFHAMRQKMPVSKKEVEDIFDSITSSGDSLIYYSDFLAAMLQLRINYCDDLVQSAFEKFDVDNSGTITLENLKILLGDTYMGVPVEEFIEEFDTDNSGELDYEEFLFAVKGMSHKKKQQNTNCKTHK